MLKMNFWDWIAMTFLIIGGLNWGLVGLFNFDLVATLFGTMSAVSRVIYLLVGLGALYTLGSALFKVGALGGETQRETTLKA